MSFLYALSVLHLDGRCRMARAIQERRRADSFLLQEISIFLSLHLPLFHSYVAYFRVCSLISKQAPKQPIYSMSSSLICESLHELRFDGSIGISETAKPPNEYRRAVMLTYRRNYRRWS